MKKWIFTATGFFFLTAILAFNLITDWKIGKDFAITFDSEDASGVFTSFSGTLQFDPKNLKDSKFDVKIPVESIDTDNGLKNRHAKGEKWFDAEKFPFITYRSNLVQKTATGYMVKGTLTIKDVSRPVTIPFKFTPNGNAGTFDGFFTVNRMDYKIGKEGEVGDDIRIKIKVPVTR